MQIMEVRPVFQLLRISILLFPTILAHGQQIVPVAVDPTGRCVGFPSLRLNINAPGHLSACIAGSWALIGGGGGGGSTPGGVSGDLQVNVSGSLGPVHPSSGTAGFPYWNGTIWSVGNIPTGGSGALDCITTPGQCDIVTTVVPRYASLNLWTGGNDFSGASFLKLTRGSGAPSGGCTTSADVGKVYIRSDAASVSSSLYTCDNTGASTYAWELAGGGGLSVYDGTTGSAISAPHIVTGSTQASGLYVVVNLTGLAAFTTLPVCTAIDTDAVTPVQFCSGQAGSGGSNCGGAFISTPTKLVFVDTSGAGTNHVSYMCVGN